MNYVAARCEELDDRRSYQQWKRHVTQHGVFGVDKDSTAVMLTKLSLWINSAMQDEPFVTIDTHIKCGNSLVCGTPPGFRLANFEKRANPEKFRELIRRIPSRQSTVVTPTTSRIRLGSVGLPRNACSLSWEDRFLADQRPEVAAPVLEADGLLAAPVECVIAGTDATPQAVSG